VRAVFDTVILVRALINPYGRWGRLLFDHADDYQLVVSPPIVAEYLDVLRRPEITRKYRNAATRDPRAVLDRIGSAEAVMLADVAPVSRDPEDDKFLATARVAGAGYIVTEDDDLLVLGQHEGTRIVSARTFLSLIEQDEDSELR
jgi:putative PIN family toxin of toxin-antitoxin system